jgi:hypothetical protein
MLWKIPLRIILDATAAFKALTENKPGTFIAVFKAHLHYVKWIFIKKNRIRLPKLKTKALIAVYKGSVVWQYFVRNRKTFSEIIYLKK